MIRHAIMPDKARIIRLLANSRGGAGFDQAEAATGFHFDFDPAYAERLFTTHLLMPNMLCLVLDIDDAAQGVLMAVAAEHPFGPVRLATETLWWIEPDYRGRNAVRMLEAFEDWARGQDCDYSGMAGMGASPQVASLYVRRGYRAAELHFLKAL
jgi:GNAT superfamily N-acetyltransferase